MPLRTSSSLVLPDVWTNLLISAHIIAHAYERTSHPSIHPSTHTKKKTCQIHQKERGSRFFLGWTDADEKYTRMQEFPLAPCCLRPRHALHRKMCEREDERLRGTSNVRVSRRNSSSTNNRFKLKTLNKWPIHLKEYMEHTLIALPL